MLGEVMALEQDMHLDLVHHLLNQLNILVLLLLKLLLHVKEETY